jgi:hypothetical protein
MTCSTNDPTSKFIYLFIYYFKETQLASSQLLSLEQKITL